MALSLVFLTESSEVDFSMLFLDGTEGRRGWLVFAETGLSSFLADFGRRLDFF